ncbi:hypothetical protein ACH4M4_33580 [Streptomyces sp. NPDC017254]|uniref:hypothetical protein n=1 Tax=unclassified Streptomyces TaxID=2593676 RepID=UPI0037BCC9A6
MDIPVVHGQVVVSRDGLSRDHVRGSGVLDDGLGDAQVRAQFVQFLVLLGELFLHRLEHLADTLQRRQVHADTCRLRQQTPRALSRARGPACVGLCSRDVRLGRQAQLEGLLGRLACVPQLAFRLRPVPLRLLENSLEFVSACGLEAGVVALLGQLGALGLQDGDHLLQLRAALLGVGELAHGLDLLQPGVVEA